MTLETLVNLSDWGVSMILIGVRENDWGNTGYDFEEKKWVDNYLYTPEKVTTIGEFKKTHLYRTLRKCKIVDVSSFNTANVEKLRDVDTLRGQITVFRVRIPLGKIPAIRFLDLHSPNLDKKKKKKRKKSFGKWNNKKGEDKKQDSQSSTTSPVTDVEP